MLQFDSLRCVKAFLGQQVHLSTCTRALVVGQKVMLLCSWDRVINPMDSSGRSWANNKPQQHSAAR